MEGRDRDRRGEVRTKKRDAGSGKRGGVMVLKIASRIQLIFFLAK